MNKKEVAGLVIISFGNGMAAASIISLIHPLAVLAAGFVAVGIGMTINLSGRDKRRPPRASDCASRSARQEWLNPKTREPRARKEWEQGL